MYHSCAVMSESLAVPKTVQLKTTSRAPSIACVRVVALCFTTLWCWTVGQATGPGCLTTLWCWTVGQATGPGPLPVCGLKTARRHRERESIWRGRRLRRERHRQQQHHRTVKTKTPCGIPKQKRKSRAVVGRSKCSKNSRPMIRKVPASPLKVRKTYCIFSPHPPSIPLYSSGKQITHVPLFSSSWDETKRQPIVQKSPRWGKNWVWRM
jgi:hypothetical protein